MEITARAAGRIDRARTGASKVGEVGISTLGASMAFGSTKKEVRVFALEEVKLLKCKIF